MSCMKPILISCLVVLFVLTLFREVDSAALSEEMKAAPKGSVKGIFMHEKDATNFFRHHGRSAVKAPEEINAEQSLRLVAEERKREFHEEHGNELESYAEEDHNVPHEAESEALSEEMKAAPKGSVKGIFMHEKDATNFFRHHSRRAVKAPEEINAEQRLAPEERKREISEEQRNEFESYAEENHNVPHEAESAALSEEMKAAPKGSVKGIFMHEKDATNFFRRRSRRAVKAPEEINAEQRLAPEERKREISEEQRNEFESYAEENHNGSVKGIFMHEKDATNFFKRHGRRAVKAPEETNAEQSLRLAAEERKREFHEEHGNELESYAEEDHNELEESGHVKSEQWRELHYKGAEQHYEHNRETI
ncbi:putative cartilage matrix-associated protein isoform X2 [Brachyhypopomus gauderio]|uniref:putative cartilage matrix-associated protein isoform X2 n=1 Tax=Brachyhypopomus gauderio TaxID=698409 RepID=UPI0040430B72